ncbi:MAG: 3-dehydroquinate synthase [Chromatiales bacterium]
MEETASVLTVDVKLGERSYPIHIGPGLLTARERIVPCVRGRQVMAVTNATVAPLYLDRLRRTLGDFHVESVVLPDGEAFKTLEVMERIITALVQARFDRGCTLVALGGGVIGDITGFAAACYQRGVDYIQVPTTLLAQVDSSVGGKTAVNHILAKNMIGAFHQPRLVIADTQTLDTLPDRELRAGIAEIIKYGLIRDAAFFTWLEAHMPELLQRQRAALAFAIERCCRNKAEIVAADEREAGERALLNLGHTFGHAIETGLGYGNWLHGEAVAAGMCLAARLSARISSLSAGDAERITTLIHAAGLPTHLPSSLDADRMLELMAVDKKAKDGRIRLVVLKRVGEAVVTSDCAPGILAATLQDRADSLPAIAQTE